MRKKLWALIAEDTGDLLGYEEAQNGRQAVRRFAVKLNLTKREIENIYAIDASMVVETPIPGYLLTAVEYGPEWAFGPRDSAQHLWEEYEKTISRLNNNNIRNVVGWVRVDSVLDLWYPVVIK